MISESSKKIKFVFNHPRFCTLVGAKIIINPGILNGLHLKSIALKSFS